MLFICRYCYQQGITPLHTGEPTLAQLRVANRACLHAREPNQVGTQTEARTLARRQANAGGKQVQEREGHGGNDGAGKHLLHIQLLLGDDEARQGHRETLQKVLDGARNELSNCETVHTYNQGGENVFATGLRSNV